MDVADLKYFETVARLGSMNKAASELHTVQSNVTARIRALEGEIGVPLFVRHTRGVSLTPAGQRMLPYAGRMAKLLADARHAAMDDGPPSGALVLGTPDTMATIDAIQSTPDLKAIVFRRGCSYRQRLEGWFSEMGMVLATPMEFGALDTILACVAGGVGVTLLPRGVAQAASQRHALRLHALPPDKAYVETLFIRRQDAYPSSAMLAFLDAVTAMGATGKAG